jgi:hypothetical protein
VHRHADAHASERPARARGEPPLRRELVEHFARHDDHVGRLACGQRLHQPAHRLPVELHLMAGKGLGGRLDEGTGGTARDHPDFIRGSRASQGEKQHKSQSFHARFLTLPLRSSAAWAAGSTGSP